jgi:DNA-directed RNA polymerase specialized sigma subunit
MKKPRFDLEDNNKEVAQELGLTEDGVNYIKSQALKKAKAILKEKGYKATDFFRESKDE